MCQGTIGEVEPLWEFVQFLDTRFADLSSRDYICVQLFKQGIAPSPSDPLNKSGGYISVNMSELCAKTGRVTMDCLSALVAMLVGARSDFEGCINGLDIKFEGRGSSVVCTIWYNEQLADDTDASDDFAAELAELFSVPEDVMAEFSNTSGAHTDDDAEAGALPAGDVTV